MRVRTNSLAYIAIHCKYVIHFDEASSLSCIYLSEFFQMKL